MSTAFTALITEREHYFSEREQLTPPRTYQHTPAADKPTKVVFPDDLEDDEIAEVITWKQYGTAPSLAAAIAKVAEYVAYNVAYRVWKLADEQARIAQYNWVRADSAVLNKGTTSAGASDTGVGSAPPPHYVPPQGTHEPEP